MVKASIIARALKAATTVEEVKKVARKYYNDGCSTLIECYEDSELEELLGTDRFDTIVSHEQEQIADRKNGEGWYW